MRLNDNELDCLIVSNAGFLAQKRLARGLQLNYPEAVAIISSQVIKLFNIKNSPINHKVIKSCLRLLEMERHMNKC